MRGLVGFSELLFDAFSLAFAVHRRSPRRYLILVCRPASHFSAHWVLYQPPRAVRLILCFAFSRSTHRRRSPDRGDHHYYSDENRPCLANSISELPLPAC